VHQEAARGAIESTGLSREHISREKAIVLTGPSSRPGGKLKYRREPIHTAAYEVGLRPGEKAPEEKAEALRPSFCETIAGSHV
jgi:hypothetical protein